MNWSSGVSPVEELLGLGVEVVELALDDRDHVPGDVLVGLGVLERAGAALAALLLAISWSSSVCLGVADRFHRARCLASSQLDSGLPRQRPVRK